MNEQYEKSAKTTMDLLNYRASCRSFLDKDIPEDILNQVMEAGFHGATGGNLQPYAVIKIKNQETKDRIVNECHMQPIISNAPVNLLFCIDLRRIARWAKALHAPCTSPNSYRHFWIGFQDTIICAENMSTAADALGLGSVYIGSVDSCFDEIRDMLSLPEGVFPVVILSLGYPTKYPDPAEKLGIKTLVHEESYKDLSVEQLIADHDEKYQGRTVPASPKNVEQVKKVAMEVGGTTLVDEVLEEIEKAGAINMAQRYFGLHYVADEMAKGNDKFLESLLKAGFGWADGTNYPKK